MTDAELAILGLVAEQPRHGYQIEQVLEKRGMREWTDIGFSSIYYLLKRLERDGLIEGRLEEAARGPARKVYEITEEGRSAQHEALLDALSTPQLHRTALLVGLGNLPAVERDEAIAALRRYRMALGDQLERIQAERQRRQSLPDYVDAQFDYALAMARAELAWVNGFIKQLVSGPRSSDEDTEEG